ncbi:FHA domain-containing protein, partial [Nocardioides albidus]|uniref:FHA domain-containing protein n=1 Tax=Nocardioides albidus TaxID=1517589 RepID=UPI0013051E0D
MSRPALVVEVEGRVLRLEGKSVYRIGRAIEADVVLTAGSVSRQHAELQATDGGWVLVDNGSQFGTYVEDERVTEYPVERRITVRCGPPAPGATLAVIPAAEYDVVAATPVAPAPPAPPAPPGTTPPGTPPLGTPPLGTPIGSGSPWAPPSGAPMPSMGPPPSVPAPGARPAAAPGLPPAVSGNDATQILAMPRVPAGAPGPAP